MSGAEYWGEGVVFYLGLATDSFISQSNLAVCVQDRGQGGSDGTWYQPGRLHWSMYVYVCECVCKTPPPWLKKAHEWPTLMQRVTRRKTAKDDDRNVQFKRGARVIRFGGIYMRGCQGQCCCTALHQEQSKHDKYLRTILQMHFWDIQFRWST